METNKIICGDCIEEMKNMPDNSVDAIITDPPYDLVSINKRFSKEDSAPAQFGKDGSFSRLSKGFMGKSWDGTGIAFKPETWKEALRVIKPGAYLLSFGGTRTYHRMACAIEDAGFEIRDCIMWIYGSGFPKSLNIGKQIDKMQGNERKEWIEPRQGGGVKKGQAYEGGFETIAGIKECSIGNTEWEGWGTALKPAVEPIVLARKPLSEKNVALNVLKWGTGGINIDKSRIEINPEIDDLARCNKIDNGMFGVGNNNNNNNAQQLKEKGLPPLGRFPANIILDEEAGHMLDEQSGKTGAFAPVKSGQKGFGGVIYGKYKTGGDDGMTFYDNGKLGGASRFFYCAKASKSERNEGCEELEGEYKSYVKNRRCKKCGYQEVSGTPCKCETPEWEIIEREITTKNNHPTVKPIALMEYLIKLVSRENAIILDPFLGSGTTACACLKLNRKFIGFEKEAEYVKIAEARIKSYLEQKKL